MVSGMSRSIESLRTMSDAEVIAEHDEVAKNTGAGTAYWMDELERRSRERFTEASNRLAIANSRLAIASFRLSIVSTVIAVVAVVVSIVHS